MLLVQSEYFVLLEFTLEHYIVVDLKIRNKLDEPTAWSAEQKRQEETLESGFNAGTRIHL